MGIVSRLLNDSFYQGLGNATIAGSRFFITLFLARDLPKIDFSVFAISFAVVNGMLICFNLGIPTGVNFYISSGRYDASSILRAFSRFRGIVNLVLSIIALAIIVSYFTWSDFPVSYLLLAVICLLLFNVLSFQSIIDAFFMGAGLYRHYFFRTVLTRELLVFMLFFAVKLFFASNIFAVYAVLVALNLLHLAYCVSWSIKSVSNLNLNQNSPNDENSLFTDMKVRSFVKKFIPTSVSSVFYGWLLVPAVGLFWDASDAADFTVVFRVVNIPLMIIPVGIAAIPFSNKLAGSRRAKLGVNLLVLSCLLIFGGFYVLMKYMPEVTSLLFGDKYAGLSLLLFSLALFPLARALRDVLLPFYIKAGRLWFFSMVNIFITICIVPFLFANLQLLEFTYFLVGALFIPPLVQYVYIIRYFGEDISDSVNT